MLLDLEADVQRWQFALQEHARLQTDLHAKAQLLTQLNARFSDRVITDHESKLWATSIEDVNLSICKVQQAAEQCNSLREQCMQRHESMKREFREDR